MTLLCGGGTSGPKPNIGDSIVYNAGGIAAVLEMSGYGTLATLAVVLGTLLFDATALCGSDPPAQPTFTVAELEALFTLQPSTDFTNAVGKLKDLVTNVLWFQLCTCTSGPQPALPAPVAFPTGITLGVNGGACAAWTSGEIVDNSAGASTHALIPTTDVQLVTLADYRNNSVVIPPGTTQFQLKWTCDQDAYSGAGIGVTPAIVLSNSGGTNGPGGIGVVGTVGLEQTFTFPMLAGYDRITIGHTKAFSGAYNTSSHAVLTAFCGGNSVGPGTAGCCPPDASVTQLLQQIQQLVTVIQRQHVPQAYVNGATHSGLTGDGSIAVSQLLGVKLSPSTIPSHFGVEAGNPDELWLDSWITWGNVDGWTPREFLRHSPQISLPANAHLYSELGYSFAPGLVVDVQELEPEP